MGYLIGVVLVIVLIILIILIVRLIMHALTWVGHWSASAARAVEHAASVTGGFLATVLPPVVIGAAAAGLLWLAAWLVAEVRYFLRDSRRERRWFAAIAPRIAVAMAPGGAYTVANLVVPPRSPVLGRSVDHPLTLPIPRSLQRLAGRGARAAGLSIAVLPASRPADDDASQPGSGGFAAGPSAIATRAGCYPVVSCPSPRMPVPESLNRLPTPAQLDRVRELVDSGARVSVSIRAIAGELARSDRDPSPADGPGKGRVIVERSDSVQVGHGNRQYNFYTYTVVTPRLADLAKRLSDPDVVAAARRLGADPENPAARRALLAKLAPGGLRLGGPTSELQISALRTRATRSGSWLDGTVLFRDVSNGQIGTGNTQRNEFIYAVTPSGTARELLASNRELAKALIDCAFPAHGRGDTAALSRALTSAIERTPVDPGDGRIRSQHYDLPGEGRTLRIQAHDGVSVGPRSTVARTDRVVAGPTGGIIRESSPYDIATRGKLRGAAPEPPAPEPDRIPHPGKITRRGPGTGRMGP